MPSDRYGRPQKTAMTLLFEEMQRANGASVRIRGSRSGGYRLVSDD
jgi:hypothetical protein